MTVDPFSVKLKILSYLHDRKQEDYGQDKDPYANVRQSAQFGVQPWVGAMVRLNDKVKRIQSFLQKDKLANEPIVDSFMDIAVYAIIAWILYEEANGVRSTTDELATYDPDLVVSQRAFDDNKPEPMYTA